jgi:hypothetical protein
MLAAQAIQHLPRGLCASSLYVGQAALNPFDGLHAIQQRLVRLGVLHDEFGFAVYGQHERMPGVPEAIQEIDRIALELTEGTNVVGKVEHHILIQFALNVMIT